MKLETLAARTVPLLPYLRCPLCGAAFALLQGRSLLCANGHCFDLSAKGYVNLAPSHNQAAEKYDAELFASRTRVFADGFYTHIANAVTETAVRYAGLPAASENGVTAALLALDVGCGEGYYARALARELPGLTVVGADLSRDALIAAARQANGIHWLVADLTRLPLTDASVALLLDVLTPADYREFARALAPDGVLLKVVPADDYLVEIRRAAAGMLRGGAFSNARVVEHLEQHAQVLERRLVRRTLPVTPEQARAFTRMTPMTFSLSQAQRDSITFTEITVAMELLVCRLKPV